MAISLVSCEDPDYRQVEAEPVDIRLLRSETLLAAQDDAALRQGHEQLQREAPVFYSTYFEDMLGLGPIRSDSALASLCAFVDYPLTAESESRIAHVFADLGELENELEIAFGRYHSLFPEENVPRVVTMNTGFNYGVYPMDSVLALGLEFYLGENDTIIKRLPIEQFPAYLREKMRPDQLLSNALRGWMLVHFQSKAVGESLLAQMIYQGKIHYLLHLVLPDEPEHLLFAFSEEEMAWSKENEFMIWQAIVKEDMLFSKDRKLIRNWTGNGPFTRGFGEESPAPLAPFVGERMVKDYMDEHPDMSATQLLDVDPNGILRSYRPKK